MQSSSSETTNSRSSRRSARGGIGRTAIVAAGLIAAFSTPAEALDRRLRIVNDSKHAMTGFFGTNVGVRDWGESLVGDNVLQPGTSVVLDFEDGSGYCRFRFRAVFDDGKELVRESVNVCEVGTYRYTD